MTTIFARFRVADYATWRTVYDRVAPTLAQQPHSLAASVVYQSEADPNDLTILHEFASSAAAKAFVESVAMRETMAQAGVLGVPAAWFGNER